MYTLPKWLKRNWPNLVLFSLAFIAVLYIGSDASETLFSPSYECGSGLYDSGKGALKEHGVSTRCPELVIRRKCNTQALQKYKELAEEHGMDSFYGQMYRDMKEMVPNPYVLTIYYGVGGDKYKAFNVFDGEYYPSKVPTGFCESAPDLKWSLTEEEEKFMEEEEVIQDNGSSPGLDNGSLDEANETS